MTEDAARFAAARFAAALAELDAEAAGDDPAGWLAADLLQRLGPLPPGANLGILYLTDTLAPLLPAMVERLRRLTGADHWVAALGMGVLGGAGTGVEAVVDGPAASVLLCSLPDGAFHVLGDGEAAAAGAATWAGRHGAPFGLVHADMRNPRAGDLVTRLSSRLSAYMVGGLTAPGEEASHWADGPARGGVSGVLFGRRVEVATGLTQGCSPIGPARTITAGGGSIVETLDDRPALQAFRDDVGELLARDLRRAARYIHPAFPVPGSDTADYLVRNLAGLDPRDGAIGVTGEVTTGQRLMFVRRDPNSALDDLRRMLADVMGRLPSAPVGAHYVSCIARGTAMFGDPGDEVTALRSVLGDVPLAGFHAAGEFCNGRLHGYTGVLTVFL